VIAVVPLNQHRNANYGTLHEALTCIVSIVARQNKLAFNHSKNIKNFLVTAQRTVKAFPEPLKGQ
jgi:hypothetical protein